MGLFGFKQQSSFYWDSLVTYQIILIIKLMEKFLRVDILSYKILDMLL
jgi:hypothetical protein